MTPENGESAELSSSKDELSTGQGGLESGLEAIGEQLDALVAEHPLLLSQVDAVKRDLHILRDALRDVLTPSERGA